MKSKFTQIVNIKKRNLDKIELNLARTRNEAAMIEGFIAQAAEQISKFEMPSSGSATDLRGSLELLGAMRREKNLLTELLELMKKKHRAPRVAAQGGKFGVRKDEIPANAGLWRANRKDKKGRSSGSGRVCDDEFY